MHFFKTYWIDIFQNQFHSFPLREIKLLNLNGPILLLNMS
ncbi:hypothetical protein G436_1648 [Leptospira interrogans serovar Hardjo str. Norma]|uniref:Uncharacterized protein n=1 Tax=Leptospira interrogans serovar Hardjo str. Norma TaxID=1279460 RepID=A0A0M4NXF0_LEPIR|nr:hypothetical protein G436_1648 [Leptospira interrogans serovar Hardjo str. Norma]